MQRNNRLRLISYMFVNLVVLIIFSPYGFAAEEYVFERMWPTLQQPWYFLSPDGVEVDAEGNIYVADTGNHRIDKFTQDGRLITSWGGEGSGSGQLEEPTDIVIDTIGNVYVADSDNHRIQKFTSDGRFLSKWGIWGYEDGEFQFPSGLAIGPSGDVYVSDLLNHRIQKFTPEGVFITKWGDQGSGDGQFERPRHMVIDQSGYVYVVDGNNDRIQKFTADGEFITKWGTQGSGDGEFSGPRGIAVNESGIIYVLDTGNGRIQTFTADGVHLATYKADWDSNDKRLSDPCGIAIDKNGNIVVADTLDNRIQKLTSEWQFITNWESQGGGDGNFRAPAGLAIDTDGNVYVADTDNSRIQKFTWDGRFITKWGQWGDGAGDLMGLCGMVIDATGNLYVVEYGGRIQKFSATGVSLLVWGTQGEGDGQFKLPQGIGIGPDGNLYVADTKNHRVQRFGPDGTFINKWGAFGTGDGYFDQPEGIAVDSTGYVYVADTGNCRIQKFTSGGQYVTQWGEFGTGNGQFRYPEGIWVDQNDTVYVADTDNARIQVFDKEGNFMAKWGSQGGEPGQMSSPSAVATGNGGLVYVVESANNRIQVFSKEGAPPVSGPDKAVIVAGGGPYPGNNLWDATEMCANYAYRALTYQGYTKDTIYYLSADTDLDVDGNGILDDVDADATNTNLHYAVSTWASDTNNLLIYMVDHGGNGTFRMSGTELLYATELDGWLDALQETIPGHITIVYDACESGSFLPYLTPPSGKQRYVAASTSLGEESIFVGNGTVSFSFLFWGHMFNGESFYNSFVNAQKSVSTTYNQTCQLDGNGNGIGNEKEDKDLASQLRIGNETKSAGDVPVIGSVSPAQSLDTATSALIYADQVIDADGIARVWAVITPPGYSSGGTDTPVTNLPTLDLNSVGNNRYEGTYTGFTTAGTYNIAIFAMDRKGVLSLPVQTSVTVATTSSCLIVGSDLSIPVPCVQYLDNAYGLTLGFYSNPGDPSGYYWTLVPGTFKAGEGESCLYVGSDLSIPIPCASYNGTQFEFTLDFYPNPYAEGLYWKMDLSTFKVK